VIDKFCYWFFGWWDKQCQKVEDLWTFPFPKPKKLKSTECPKCGKDFGCECE
jgi:hypothetical protein